MKYEKYKKTLCAITKGEQVEEHLTRSGNHITILENGLGFIIALADVINAIGVNRANKDSDFILTDLLTLDTLEEAQAQRDKWALIE